MPAHFIGVRHHSPACARLVRDVITDLQPAHVLIEGPADFNDRIDELLLGHELPVAIFTSYRDEARHHASWSPLCEHSPEWVGLTEGRRSGAEVRFIDLPAWHDALLDRSNRFADAEQRYGRATDRLCEVFAVDDVDSLWDHLFEIDPDPALAANLEAYFDLVRGDELASEQDEQREAFMAEWVRAAVADAGRRPVVVISGGFHRPALVRRLADLPRRKGWPEVPAMPAGAVGGSFLVPFSFRRLDAFDGYQSGMPSPHYYQQLWERGVEAAGDDLTATVVQRLRERRQAVSTADLIAARTLSHGLAALRGHPSPGRVDVLEGLVTALVTQPLDQPPPWSRRGRLAPGTDPVIVEMVAALSGSTVGRLHPDTPHPPFVHDVEAELERHRIPLTGRHATDLTTDAGLAASRVLHRLRVLRIPGVERVRGPVPGGDPVLDELWDLRASDLRLPALIEAGSYGATLAAAAGAALGDRVGDDPEVLSSVLFDAALCGLPELSARVVDDLSQVVATIPDLGGLAGLLTTSLALWRHDRLFGTAGDPVLARIVDAATTRALWVVDGIRGGPAPADSPRLRTLIAVRDAVLHAEGVLTTDREAVVAVFARAAAADRPPDLRGAGVGIVVVLDAAGGSPVEDAVRLAGQPDVLGDFLAGLLAVAREHVAEGTQLLAPLDELIGGYTEPDFLRALPALRLAFAWLPPREREAFAERLLERRGLRGSARSLLRLSSDAGTLARAREVEGRVADLLAREALLS